MACAAIGTPTPGVNLVELITGVLPGGRAESAYPFNPWELPVHPPVPVELPLPPAEPDDPRPSDPSDGDTFPTPTGPGIGGSAFGIPANVLDAYRRAADLMAARDPGCHLTWPVLAGVGRIESNHANGGNLRADGTTVTRIVGIALDGRPGVATIGDSDNGALDGDTVWDHAVGPMQFLPGTWQIFGQDGNNDGRRDPHNMYDSALAAAIYLCQGDRDLRVEANLRAALFAYNPSTAYVNAVLAWIRAYERGGVPVEPHPIPGASNPTGAANRPTTPPPTRVAPTPAPKPTTPPPTQPADRVAPTAPTGLRVVDHSGTSVTLAWTAATDNVGITAYEVYAGDRLVGATIRTSVTVAGLTENTSYSFTVRATDAAGNRSQASLPVTVVTDVTPPSPVSGVEVTASSAESISLRWAPAADNLPGDLTYRIYRDGASEPIAETTATTYTDGTVAAATTYAYTIVAVDASGNPSDPASITVDREAPSAPSGVSITFSEGVATVTWSPSTDDVGIARYVIVVESAGAVVTELEAQCAPAAGSATDVCSASLDGLDALTDYTFTIQAVDGAGNSSQPATTPYTPSTETTDPSTEPSEPADTAPGATDPTGEPTGSPSGSTTPSGDQSTPPNDGEASEAPDSSLPPAREESTPPITTAAPEQPDPDNDPEPSDESTSAGSSASDEAPSTGPTESAEPSPSSEPSPTESASPEPSPEETVTSAALVLDSLANGESVVTVGSVAEMQEVYAGLIDGGTVVSGPALKEPMDWKAVDAAELWQSSETVWVARADDVLVGLHPGDSPTIELQQGDRVLTVELQA